MKTRFSILAILLVLAFHAGAQTVAQWRGPARDGKYNETNLLTSWPAEGPALMWKTEEIGNGYASPTVTSNRLYIAGEIDTAGYLFAFDLKGKLIWKTNYGKEWVASYEGARCAPTVVGDLIYVCSGLGNVACIEAKSGAIKWSADMRRDFHGRFTMFGHAESSLVEREKVFLVPGGADTSVLAMNRFTGKVLWTCKGHNDLPGYNSPYLIRLKERNVLVTFTNYTMLGIDAETGELLWTHDQDNIPLAERKPGNGDTHSNTVYFEDGFIYYIAGDGNCAVKLSLSDDGRKITQVWRNKAIDNYMGGFVKLGNYLYTCLSEKRQLVCLDASNGQVTDSLKCGAGSVIFADNLLYYYNQRGEVKLVKPDPKKMEILGSFKVTAGTKEHFSHPVISDGIFYIRHGKALMAYDIRKK